MGREAHTESPSAVHFNLIRFVEVTLIYTIIQVSRVQSYKHHWLREAPRRAVCFDGDGAAWLSMEETELWSPRLVAATLHF